MVSEFQANGVKETIRKYAVEMLDNLFVNYVFIKAFIKLEVFMIIPIKHE